MDEYSVYFKDQRQFPYINEQFLNNFGLDNNTIMEYFSLSHFYESNSINQRCKVQKIDFLSHKNEYNGIEFNLIHNENPYVISKEVRKNPYDTVIISYYYCLNGVIYQSPDLNSVVLSNIQSVASEMNDILKLIE